MSFLLSRRQSIPIATTNEHPGPSILLNPEENAQTPTTDIPPSSPTSSRLKPTPPSPAASTSSLTSTSTSVRSAGNRTPGGPVGGNPTSPRPLTSKRPTLTCTSSKVSFAPLPEVPPELKRRSSITLGVAARKNLISNGNRAGMGAGGPGKGGGTTLYMTDEEWEEYKKRFTDKSNSDAIDLGEKAKGLWRRVRSSSQSSQTSSTTNSSDRAPSMASISSPRRIMRPIRRNSSPEASMVDSTSTSVSTGSTLGPVEEEEKYPSGQQLGPVGSVPEGSVYSDRFAAWRHGKSDTAGEAIVSSPDKLSSSPPPMLRKLPSNDGGPSSPTAGSRDETGSRARSSAILGFDRLSLDKTVGGRFGL